VEKRFFFREHSKQSSPENQYLHFSQSFQMLRYIF